MLLCSKKWQPQLAPFPCIGTDSSQLKWEGNDIFQSVSLIVHELFFLYPPPSKWCFWYMVFHRYTLRVQCHFWLRKIHFSLFSSWKINWQPLLSGMWLKSNVGRIASALPPSLIFPQKAIFNFNCPGRHVIISNAETVEESPVIYDNLPRSLNR